MTQKQDHVRKINFTGKPLTVDMLDSHTIEPGKGGTLLFHLLYLKPRLRLSMEYLNLHVDTYDFVIINNDPFGVALFEAMSPTTKFVISWKKPNSQEHAYWHVVERIKLNPSSDSDGTENNVETVANFGTTPFAYPAPSGFKAGMSLDPLSCL